MADVKISALPAASTLTPADVLPLVQGTTTAKVSLTQLDSRWVSSSTGGTVNGGLTVNPYLAVGTNPAQSGAIRIPNGEWISARNAANNADIPLLFATNGNQTTLSSSNGIVNFATNGIGFAKVTSSGTTLPSYVAVGTTPAASGILRLPNNQVVNARNAANDADLPVLTVSNANSIIVGGSGVALVRVGCVDLTSTGMTFVNGTNIAFNTATGTKIGTTATQKIGFWGATPVVRPTGWVAPTGTATRATYSTTTATVTELAERLKGLIDDLTALGLIGP